MEKGNWWFSMDQGYVKKKKNFLKFKWFTGVGQKSAGICVYSMCSYLVNSTQGHNRIESTLPLAC